MPFGGDAVRFEWNGVGTGDVLAGNALPRYRRPPASDNGKIVTYRIEHATANQSETGKGSWAHSTSTLLRTGGVKTSVDGGVEGTNLVSFSAGLKIVSWVASSDDLDEIDLISEVLAFTPTNYTPA